jgi:hypothetical protein
MMGRIRTDVFFQDRYMLNKVTTRTKLVRNNNTFCLMASGAQPFKIVVIAASLLACEVKISPSVFLAHIKTLQKGTAKHPIRRVICKLFTIPAGYLDVSYEKLFSGHCR